MPAETRLLYPDLSLETPLWEGGILRVAGLDEAGRGALAGPVTAAAVVLPAEPEIIRRLPGVRDSKLMTSQQRAQWAEAIKNEAVCWGIGHASHLEIDEVGIVQATRFAMQRALAGLTTLPEYLLLDAVVLSEEVLPQTVLFKGDALSLSIAAASVIAKTARDQLMGELDGQYPGYGFCHNMGYGTPEHKACLGKLGPCAIHRSSYEPVRLSLEQTGQDQSIQS